MPAKEEEKFLGNIFVKPVEGREVPGWRDKVDNRTRTLIYSLGGKVIKEEKKGEVLLFDQGKPVARVSQTFLENGVEVWWLKTLVDLNQVPDNLRSRVADWSLSSKDGNLICQEIEEECKKMGLDGDCRRALGLLVYLKKEGWEEV